MKTCILLALLALPVTASVSLAAEPPKRILVCTTTLGFRHPCIPYAEKALSELDAGEPGLEIVGWLRQPAEEYEALVRAPKTPRPPREPAAGASAEAIEKYQKSLAAYESAKAAWNDEKQADLDRKQAAFEHAMREALLPLSPKALADEKIDAVIFCNTSGALPLPDAEGFIRWIEGGGAFVGIHAATDTLKGTLPYAEMICGAFDSHGPQVRATLHAGDAAHPANGGIGPVWTLPQEEMYLFRNHDRSKARSIWFMPHHPNKPDQAGFFPVAWVRMFGNGRVFYTSLGHREDLWSPDPALKDRINPPETSKQFHNHLLGGIRWAVGLDPGSADPGP